MNSKPLKSTGLILLFFFITYANLWAQHPKHCIGIFRPSTGEWHFDLDLDGKTDAKHKFGDPRASDDRPVMGDFNGDGIMDFARYRPSTGNWFIDTNMDRKSDIMVKWGAKGDIPLALDFDRDGASELVLFRPAQGKWFFDKNFDGKTDFTSNYGDSRAIDYPVATNKRVLNLDVVWGRFRPSKGYWFIDEDLNGKSEVSYTWGGNGDVPFLGDFNGDGEVDGALFRPSTGKWYIEYQTGSKLVGKTNWTIERWGQSTDRPFVVSRGQLDLASFTTPPSNLASSSNNSSLSRSEGIQYAQIEGWRGIDNCRMAAARGGSGVVQLFDGFEGALAQLPSSNGGQSSTGDPIAGQSTDAESAQKEIAGTALILSFGTAGWAVVTAPLAATAAVAAGPAIVVIGAIAAVAGASIALIEGTKERNVSTLVVNNSDLSFKVNDFWMESNAEPVQLKMGSKTVGAYPAGAVIAPGEPNKKAPMGLFISRRKSFSYDMQGAIRLTDENQNNFYVAWHVPAVGQNACAVEIKEPGSFTSAKDFKRNSVINPGAKLMTHTVLKGRYSISCGVSDPDTEFPKIIVFIDGPVR